MGNENSHTEEGSGEGSSRRTTSEKNEDASVNRAGGSGNGRDGRMTENQVAGAVAIGVGAVAVGGALLYGMKCLLSSDKPSEPEPDSRPVANSLSFDVNHETGYFHDRGAPRSDDYFEFQSNHIKSPFDCSGPLAKSGQFNLNQATRKFHDECAQRSNFRCDAAFSRVIDYVTDQMKEQGFMSRREYVGSTWEYTSIPGSSDLDVLLVDRDRKNQVEVTTGGRIPGGYALLKNQDGSIIKPETKINNTKSVIQKILNRMDFLEFGVDEVKIIAHGPAVQLDVGFELEKSSIDLVPTLEKVDGRMFVARSPKLDPEGSDRYWRISHSLDAKIKLHKADTGNGCRREVFRTCKVIRDAEPNLHHITSYKLKCTLFSVMDNCSYWPREQIGDRLLDVVRALLDAYKTGYLPDYFENDINLIASTKQAAKVDTVFRLEKFIKDPAKLFKSTLSKM